MSEQKRTPMDDIMEKLQQGVQEMFQSDRYKEYLSCLKSFTQYSFNNSILIASQKPDATLVAGYRAWEIHHDRHVRKGEKGIKIIAPMPKKTENLVEKKDPVTGKTLLDSNGKPVMENVVIPQYRVVTVFDVSQTEGKELPQIIEQPFEAIGEVTRAMLGNFIDNLYLSGIRVNLQNYGTDFAGQVQRINETANFTNSKGTIQFKQYYCITVNENMDNASKLATIYHELGHIFCGHIPCPNQKYIPTRGYLPKEVEEFEAESVCWLLCERQGIKNPSAQYLSTYLKGNGQVPNISLTNVLKAAGEIEQIRKGVSRPRKELLVKEK